MPHDGHKPIKPYLTHVKAGLDLARRRRRRSKFGRREESSGRGEDSRKSLFISSGRNCLALPGKFKLGAKDRLGSHFYSYRKHDTTCKTCLLLLLLSQYLASGPNISLFESLINNLCVVRKCQPLDFEAFQWWKVGSGYTARWFEMCVFAHGGNLVVFACGGSDARIAISPWMTDPLTILQPQNSEIGELNLCSGKTLIDGFRGSKFVKGSVGKVIVWVFRSSVRHPSGNKLSRFLPVYAT